MAPYFAGAPNEFVAQACVRGAGASWHDEMSDTGGCFVAGIACSPYAQNHEIYTPPSLHPTREITTPALLGVVKVAFDGAREGSVFRSTGEPLVTWSTVVWKTFHQSRHPSCKHFVVRYLLVCSFPGGGCFRCSSICTILFHHRLVPSRKEKQIS